jgi:hypothetical protein
VPVAELKIHKELSVRGGVREQLRPGTGARRLLSKADEDFFERAHVFGGGGIFLVTFRDRRIDGAMGRCAWSERRTATPPRAPPTGQRKSSRASMAQVAAELLGVDIINLRRERPHSGMGSSVGVESFCSLLRPKFLL